MGHPTLLVPDGLSFQVLVEVRATMRVKTLILHKSDLDYLVSFYPPPMEQLRDELTDLAEVLRWISLPKVYAKKIRKIAQTGLGSGDGWRASGVGGGGSAGNKMPVRGERLASVVMGSAGMHCPGSGRKSTAGGAGGGVSEASAARAAIDGRGGGLGSARGRGKCGGEEAREKVRRSFNRGQESAGSDGGGKSSGASVRGSLKEEGREVTAGVGVSSVVSSPGVRIPASGVPDQQSGRDRIPDSNGS
ncbi:unnamed protein product [Ectocarpus fasciculatus]